MIRITGGIYRGRKIKSPPGNISRPTIERVREALFDILGNNLEEMSFLDLYAGVGLMGLEALSRGAQEAAFVERNPKVLSLLKENLTLLKIQNAKIYSGDAANYVLRLAKKPFDLIYVDPPYATDDGETILTKLNWSELFPGTQVILHHHYKKKLPHTENLKQIRQERYGEACLSFYKRDY